MAKLKFSCILLLLLICSCTVENINLSPLSDTASTVSGKTPPYSLKERKKLIVYSSEITGLMASFPKFRSTAVNTEVVNLKYYLREYINAMEAYNTKDLFTSHRKFEKSYKKLQTLRRYLNKDEDAVLNRYLVRIKTNMTFINAIIPQDSLTTLKH
ncbi:hypothetical protein KSK37_09535 [Kaistella sp. DKR-2]|uniref:hypothetical protein n=1 Tax=Kaistella soli TaxID=2849654 RepID=UPI000B4BFFFE|nr:hypothetical protein [Kaistella soli]MBU8883323.1 hypothetical protein [Kaistella soli]